LLIGVPDGSEKIVLQTIEANRTQKDHKTLSLPGLSGTTDETEIFVFDIDRYIEL
jgi:hypothetical protein